MDEQFSNNLLDMGRVLWRMERSGDLPWSYRWAILTEGITRPQYKTLAALKNKYEQLDRFPPLLIGMTTADVQRKLISHVQGPLVFVEQMIMDWRPAATSIYMHGRAGIYWDTQPAVPVRKFELPNCDDSFRLVNELLDPKSEATVGDFISSQCVGCGHNATEWDRDGLPWCPVHWPMKGMSEWDIVRHQSIARQDSQIAF